MASAAGVIQFNKPEAARDSKPGGRGPLPPNPAFPAQSEGHGKPRLQTVALRAEGSGFLRGPPHPRRLAAPPPGRLPTPAAGSQSQSRHPLPPAAGNTKPLLRRGHLSRGAQLSAPREPGRSFQAAGTSREGKPDPSLGPRGQKVERRVERRERRAQEALRGLESARKHPRAEGQPRDSRN